MVVYKRKQGGEALSHSFRDIEGEGAQKEPGNSQELLAPGRSPECAAAHSLSLVHGSSLGWRRWRRANKREAL